MIGFLCANTVPAVSEDNLDAIGENFTLFVDDWAKTRNSQSETQVTSITQC